jgi:ERCC4-type nuclease
MGPENVDSAYMATGDYVLTDRCEHTVGIERKSTSDLLNSLGDGRLKAQLTRLIGAFDVPVLLIEGNFGMASDLTLRVGTRTTAWRNAAVQMALFSLQGSGIYVLQTPSADGTVDTLRVLAKRATEHCLLKYRDMEQLALSEDLKPLPKSSLLGPPVARGPRAIANRTEEDGHPKITVGR